MAVSNAWNCLPFPIPSREETTVTLNDKNWILARTLASASCKVPSSGRLWKGFCWLEKCQREEEGTGTNKKRKKKIKVTIVPSYHEVCKYPQGRENEKQKWLSGTVRASIFHDKSKQFQFLEMTIFGWLLSSAFRTSKDSIS